MAEWDLTSKICGYLDRHLAIPIIEFHEEKELYQQKSVAQTKLDLLSKTSMVDYAIDTYNSVHPGSEPPAELKKKRSDVLERLSTLQQQTGPILELLENEEVQAQIAKNTRDASSLMTFLKDNHAFKPEMLEVLYDYAKLLFDIGKYEHAEQQLYRYYILSADPARSFSALWGKFACNIMLTHWDGALEDLNRLKEFIDGRDSVTPLHQLQQRTWLIHWSLFVFFHHPTGRDDIIDMLLLQPQYINTIQTSCPHILRYLTTAVITNKRRRNVLKDLVKVIQQESNTYRDPITEFLECLYVNFDFDLAQQKLRECETVLLNDFFLVACHDEFIENARLFIFETYCRIHNTISISMLAEKLNMEPDKAEEWIVNLIREARLDAKIDSKEGHVVMAMQVPTVYHQVIEKTKTLAFRSAVVGKNIDDRSKPDRKRGGGGGGGDK